MEPPRTGWQLNLLGPGRLVAASGQALQVGPKLMVAMAYLALEGPTLRMRLADLLWPDVPEMTARNNLVQLLRRARQQLGVELISGTDPVVLDPDLQVDTRALARHSLHGGIDDRLVHDEGLLSSLEVEPGSDLADWLSAQRERLDEQRLVMLRREAERLEDAGAYAQAALRVEQRLRLDPLSEEAHRRLMRLRHLMGDREGALQAFAACRAILAKNLRTEPLPETLALATEIARGGQLPEVRARAPGGPRLARVPGVVGRTEAWAPLEAGWQAGQLLLITGPPGIGKTRLALEFAASKGRVLRVDARPGDAGTPFATNTRLARAHLALMPDVPLPVWVRDTLSRYLPELRGPAPPAPVRSPEAFQRAFDAQFELVQATSAGLAAIVVDDLQYFDSASLAVGNALISRAVPFHAGPIPPHIAVYRAGELTPEQAAVLDRLVQEGVAARVDVGPLDTRAVEDLLRGMGLPDTARLAPRLQRFTGGNPQLIYETLQHLLDLGALHDPPEHLPLPPAVHDVLNRRLDRLSNSALQVVRAAAVLQSDFTPELVADMLGAPLFDTIHAWEELERAEVLLGTQFAHDLMLEAVRASIPEGVSRLLCRSAARLLERHDGQASSIARFWMDGGDPREATTWFMRAGEAAAAQFLLREAAAFYALAADACDAAGGADRVAASRAPT
ncbi:BTAD domain-containing putative transcriptional regulator [Deinococcus sonorensis]|uniref:BTAD domain-containing putative transcriptional regulator n=1 Tax=Deinococcus sonorensis TaxID=309891 RepID=A0ABV8YE78_9DEIO